MQSDAAGGQSRPDADQPAVAPAVLHDRRRCAVIRLAAGAGGRGGLRGDLGAGLEAPVLGGDRDRGARRRRASTSSGPRRFNRSGWCAHPVSSRTCSSSTAPRAARDALAPGLTYRHATRPTSSSSRSAARPVGGPRRQRAVGSLSRAGAEVASVDTGKLRRVRTFALTDFVEARAARQACIDGIARYDPAAIIYCSMTAALLWPRPGADVARLDRRREPARAPWRVAAASSSAGGCARRRWCSR